LPSSYEKPSAPLRDIALGNGLRHGLYFLLFDRKSEDTEMAC